tara:strand:+ start:242 stop:1027 length:786 start_codon:yes stop_codon:yes gene_type:complete
MTNKVLSIDLDYIMGPTIESYHEVQGPDCPTAMWDVFYDITEFKENQFYIDQANLIYCYDIFLKAITNTKKIPKVLFGYDHDAILYLIGEETDIELYNIDHHDDIMHGMFLHDIDNSNINEGINALNRELYLLKEHYCVNEGNWGAWLHVNNKLKSFTWIRNQESGNTAREFYSSDLLGDKYSSHLRKDFTFDNYDFDFVFVCLSPLYVPKVHWHYFTMFHLAYESIVRKKAEIISKGKFQYTLHNKKAHDEILHKRPDGR